jgi:hypothetical protein
MQIPVTRPPSEQGRRLVRRFAVRVVDFAGAQIPTIVDVLAERDNHQ